MDGLHTAKRKTKPPLNVWLLILVSGLIPAVLFLFFFYEWYNQRSDLRRLTSYFVQRQNSVLAFNAMEVSTNFADLLEKAGRDVLVLSVVPPTADNLLKFYKAQLGDFTHFDAKNGNIVQEPLPFYNRIAFLNAKGDALLRIKNSVVNTRVLPLNECQMAELCDRTLFEKAVRLPIGEMYYGRIMRFYSPKAEEEQDDGASLSVAYRTEKGIYVLGIDYRHLRDHLTTPVFPYEPKRDLIDAYNRGNYIYIVDEQNNIITHPLYWDAAGIDRKSGKWAVPMRDDSENGKGPINVATYEHGSLREQFDRFLKNSFTQRGVDIFRARNMDGISRVISVSPILMSKGQFKKDGVFGHAIVSCNVDYFEEPKEKIVPYY